MFIYLHTPYAYKYKLKSQFFLKKDRLITSNLWTPSLHTYKTNTYFNKLFFKLFLKKKIFNFYKFNKFYKFFYIWVVFFWKLFSNNIYVLIKLHKAPILTKFTNKYNIVKPYQKLFLKSFRLYNYLLTLFHTLVKFKTLTFFQNFLKRFFKNVNFFKHKFLIFYIRKCIKALATSVFNLYNVNGLYFRLHGKIAKAGNSRKQKFLVKYNSISTNHKNNYMLEKFQIFTFTGSIGCTILLSLK